MQSITFLQRSLAPLPAAGDPTQQGSVPSSPVAAEQAHALAAAAALGQQQGAGPQAQAYTNVPAEVAMPAATAAQVLGMQQAQLQLGQGIAMPANAPQSFASQQVQTGAAVPRAPAPGAAPFPPLAPLTQQAMPAAGGISAAAGGTGAAASTQLGPAPTPAAPGASTSAAGIDGFRRKPGRTSSTGGAAAGLAAGGAGASNAAS